MRDKEYQTREQALADLTIEDALISLGINGWPGPRRLARGVLGFPARAFARRVLSFDRGVDRHGLDAGARRILRTYARSLTIRGQEHLPEEGPVLILSNHPGMVDTLALFAALPRRDLRILAAEKPFLRALPATSRRLFFVPEAEQGRGAVIRQTAAYLRSGGAVLTFPAGEIEPDPQVLPGALGSLNRWSPSTGLFLRLVPGLAVLPVLVRGVIAAPSLRHPFTLLRHKQEDKRRLAAALQIFMGELFPKKWLVEPRVDIFPPLNTGELARYRRPERITQCLIEEIRTLYAERLGEKEPEGYQLRSVSILSPVKTL